MLNTRKRRPRQHHRIMHNHSHEGRREREESRNDEGFTRDDAVEQEADQIIDELQESEQCVIIRNSSEVDVRTTDTQVAVSLQVALQVAIALVISISIADSDRAERVTQELLQKIQVRQINQQKTVVLNSSCVRVTSTDTEVAVNIQALLQVLVALVAKVEIG